MGARSTSEQELRATRMHRPPITSHRRSALLRDEGRRRFPHLPRKIRRMEEAMTAVLASGESDRPEFLSVRAVALLALVVIMAALVGSA